MIVQNSHADRQLWYESNRLYWYPWKSATINSVTLC